MKNVVLIGLGLILASGCVPVLIGAGIVTGYTLTNDSAIGNINNEYRILWDVCLDRIETMDAEVLVSNESRGLIKARISENDVTIKITSIEPQVQRLKVSARRLLLPKPHFAQQVFLKIVEDF